MLWLSGREWHPALGGGEMDKRQVIPLFPVPLGELTTSGFSFKGFKGWIPSFLFNPEDSGL